MLIKKISLLKYTALLLSLALMASAIFLTPQVSAIDVLSDTCKEAGVSGSSFCANVSSESSQNRVLGPNGIITKITQFIIFITGAISVIMVIIGGFRYVASTGDSNGTKQAKDTILYALVGLAVAILAQVIVSFVLSKL
jgi:hypothetical protein